MKVCDKKIDDEKKQTQNNSSLFPSWLLLCNQFQNLNDELCSDLLALE